MDPFQIDPVTNSEIERQKFNISMHGYIGRRTFSYYVDTACYRLPFRLSLVST